MRISVTEGNKRIKIVLTTKAALKIALEKVGLWSDGKSATKQRKKTLDEMAACLKTYKREYGSFVLLEASENEKEILKIVL